MLTSKAKYALRALVDLAEQDVGDLRKPVFIADVAARQDIPRRFLENILLELRKHGLVVSHRGKTGGYALAKSPGDITFADVIRAIDGPLALTPCVVKDGKALIGDCCEVPIIGDPADNGPGTAYVRPDSFTVGPEGGPGFGARVRDVLLAGPDARIDCVLDDDGSIEVRVAHEVARKLAPKNRISLMPTSVRVWAAPTP